MTNARVPNQSAAVYAAPDSASTVVGELQPSDEFKLGKTMKRNGSAWVSVIMPDGTSGYIPGNAQVCRIQNAVVAQDEVVILGAPDPSASIKMVCKRGMSFKHAGLVTRNGSQWIEVHTPSGQVGFMAPQASVTFEEAAKGKLANSAGTILFVGGFSLLLGIIGWLSESKVLPGWDGLAGGAVLLALGFLVNKRSRIALGLAVGIWCLELLSRALVIVASFAQEHAQPGIAQMVGLFIGYTLRPRGAGHAHAEIRHRASRLPVEREPAPRRQHERDHRDAQCEIGRVWRPVLPARSSGTGGRHRSANLRVKSPDGEKLLIVILSRCPEFRFLKAELED